MKLHWRQIKAVLIKEFWDLKKNTNVLVMYLIPLLLTFVWNSFIPGMTPGAALGLGFLFLVIMVGMYVPSVSLSEEKEKNTIEVLLLSPASPGDVLLGKGLMTFISILITSFLLLAISFPGNIGIINLILIFIFTMLISIFSIFLGLMVGLLSPNQVSTGTIGLPIYLVLLLIPQLNTFADSRIISFLAGILPTNYYLEILDLLLKGEQAILARAIPGLIFIVFSIVITFLLLQYIYYKKGIADD